MHGVHFYQRDRENMMRYPPHYGLQKSPSKNKEENKKDEIMPDESRIRHSVMKGLWFPILTNLTNLIMEKRKVI